MVFDSTGKKELYHLKKSGKIPFSTYYSTNFEYFDFIKYHNCKF